MKGNALWIITPYAGERPMKKGIATNKARERRNKSAGEMTEPNHVIKEFNPKNTKIRMQQINREAGTT
jgi:hypothetical protein